MEIFRIFTEDERIILYLDKDSYYGYVFGKDNSIRMVDDSVFNYIKYLKCSNNNIEVLSNDRDYRVLLDKDTNLKHYYKDGKEDIDMFLLNNGVDATFYVNKGKKSDLSLYVKVALCSFLGTRVGYILAPDIMNKYGHYITNDITDVFSHNKIDNFSTDIVIDKIENSSNLTRDEKDFLEQKDFIDDVVTTINNGDYSSYNKYEVLESLDNLDIVSFDDDNEEAKKGYTGYYSSGNPNKLNIKDYDKLTSSQKKCCIS